MSVYGQWVAATISAGNVSSSAVDLGREYDYLSVQIPSMDKCKLSLEVSERLGGTYYKLGNDVTTEEETYGRADVWRLGGYRFIKVVATTRPKADALIRVCGMRY